MVSKHFLTTAALVAAGLLFAADGNLYAGHGGGGGGGGRGGGGGGFGGGGGGRGGFGGGYGGGYGRGGYGGFGYGGYGYGGYGGFYGGGLFYGDYSTGGGYPGYYAPYAYPAPSYYAPDPYYPPRISANPSAAPSTSYYYAPATASNPPPTAANTASIHVVLPDSQATVLFDGRSTSSTGNDRYYHTPELQPGGSYNYNLRVSWMQDGRQVTQDRTIAVTPGRTTDVVFSRLASEVVPTVSVVK
jgi:uncharacterized protein (TIGR03000 family)